MYSVYKLGTSAMLYILDFIRQPFKIDAEFLYQSKDHFASHIFCNEGHERNLKTVFR